MNRRERRMWGFEIMRSVDIFDERHFGYCPCSYLVLLAFAIISFDCICFHEADASSSMAGSGN